MPYTAVDMLRSMQHEFHLTPLAEERRRQTFWTFSAFIRLFRR
jgi:hypothetical protein